MTNVLDLAIIKLLTLVTDGDNKRSTEESGMNADIMAQADCGANRLIRIPLCNFLQSLLQVIDFHRTRFRRGQGVSKRLRLSCFSSTVANNKIRHGFCQIRLQG